MRFIGLVVLLLLISITAVFSLECYTGFSVIRGRSVGSNTETCKKASDQCYKMSLEVNAASKVKLAGCSTVRCMVAKDTCTSAPLNGKMGTICCCSGDRCNANQPKSTGDKALSFLNGVIAGKNGG